MINLYKITKIKDQNQNYCKRKRSWIKIKKDKNEFWLKTDAQKYIFALFKTFMIINDTQETKLTYFFAFTDETMISPLIIR